MTRRPRQPDSLDAALDRWRSAKGTGERLSGSCRDRILHESLRGDAAEPALARLFLPVRQWVVGAALPVVLAVALGSAFWSSGPGPVTSLGPQVAGVEVQRQGGDVVFIIDNGGAPHRVLRSTDPRGLDAEPLPGRGRVFRDRIDASPGIVYYRID